jgi:hypothetical protein
MVLSYKSYRWLYEREWRLFAERGPARYSKTRCVTHVYMGSRIDAKKKTQLQKALQSLGISYSSIKISQYGIKFEE